jgi:hypothetical protein
MKLKLKITELKYICEKSTFISPAGFQHRIIASSNKITCMLNEFSPLRVGRMATTRFISFRFISFQLLNNQGLKTLVKSGIIK